MKNRESLYPGRVKLTPVDAANGIYDLVRADEPQEEGTPLNKKLLDYAVAACGVTAGTATALTLDDEFGGFTLTDGAKVNFRLHVASGANPTLNVNGTGAKYITNRYGVPLFTSLPAGAWVSGTYSIKIDAFVVEIPDAEYKIELNSFSWDRIAALSESGAAETLFQIGDEKDITIDGETITMVIVGFDHDDKTDGSGKAGITFGMKNLMASTRQMNSSNTSSGGFTGSAMYAWLTGTLLPALPSDLQAVLKSVNKKTSAGAQSTTINTNSMKVFLFSEVEVFGTTTYSVAGEGEQYDYFATTNNRIKYLSNGSEAVDTWWERSPYASDSVRFCAVHTAGSASTNGASVARGVCFGFCV